MARNNQILATTAVIVVIIAGLYLADHYWVSPSLGNHGKRAKAAYLMAPAFTLTALGGRKVSLDDYRGKVVLLNFWATDCGYCRDGTPGFVEMQRRYGPQGFQIIGISMDESFDPVKSFDSEFHVDYPVVLGNAKLAELYGGIFGLPTSFLVGRDGRIYDEVPGEVDRARWEREIEELLAQSPGAADPAFQAAGESAQINVETPTEMDSEIPGLNLTGLNKWQLALLKDALSSETCACGCAITVMQCRTTDRLCATSRDMAKAELENLRKSAPTI